MFFKLLEHVKNCYLMNEIATCLSNVSPMTDEQKIKILNILDKKPQ